MDELEQQTREVLAGQEVTKNIFPFQVLSVAVVCARWHQSGVPACACVSSCICARVEYARSPD